MMKWGRKKTSPAGSSSLYQQLPSTLNVFLWSWILRLKIGRKGRVEPVSVPASVHEPASMRRKSSKSPRSASWDGGRFYSMEEDEFYWRLSFDNGRYEDEKSLCSLDHKLNVSPVSNGRKIRDLLAAEASWERMRRKDLRAKKAAKEVVSEIKPEAMIRSRDEDSGKSLVGYSRRTRSKSLPSLNLGTIAEANVTEGPSLKEEWERQKNMKINEIMLMSEKLTKSVHVSRRTQRRRSKQGRKVKSYSPRTAARVECKIQALEELKKTRMKVKETNNERMIKDAFRAGNGSFAIVKSSFDPQQDFRDSMVEMIMEKDIRRPEELEELLACYLTLNCDEYHDLIVKVFRQVWFELSQLSKILSSSKCRNCSVPMN